MIDKFPHIGSKGPVVDHAGIGTGKLDGDPDNAVEFLVDGAMNHSGELLHCRGINQARHPAVDETKLLPLEHEDIPGVGIRVEEADFQALPEDHIRAVADDLVALLSGQLSQIRLRKQRAHDLFQHENGAGAHGIIDSWKGDVLAAHKIRPHPPG